MQALIDFYDQRELSGWATERHALQGRLSGVAEWAQHEELSMNRSLSGGHSLKQSRNILQCVSSHFFTWNGSWQLAIGAKETGFVEGNCLIYIYICHLLLVNWPFANYYQHTGCILTTIISRQKWTWLTWLLERHLFTNRGGSINAMSRDLSHLNDQGLQKPRCR